MPRVAILGQGFVGSIFSVGVERIKRGEVALYGVPLRDELPYKVKDIKIVASYDVDESKVGKSVAEVCAHYWGGEIPKSLEKIIVAKTIIPIPPNH
jgi:myo-inositol-1-phosphate synthase